MRIWRLLFTVGLLAAMLVPASGASAKPHETAGEPATECVVDGLVALSGHPNGGIDSNPSVGHYEFVSINVPCIGKKGGEYSIAAEGDTTDLWHGNTDDPGEDCAQGGSAKIDKDGDGFPEELHSGTLEAAGPEDLTGEVHFARLGTTVLADGPLWKGTVKGDQDNPDQFFQAELEFVPTKGTCTKEDPITEASLTGTAEIYNKAWVHDCSQEELSKPINDPHCDI